MPVIKKIETQRKYQSAKNKVSELLSKIRQRDKKMTPSEMNKLTEELTNMRNYNDSLDPSEQDTGLEGLQTQFDELEKPEVDPSKILKTEQKDHKKTKKTSDKTSDETFIIRVKTPNDQRTGLKAALDKEIDNQIELLSNALLKLQRAVPALDRTAKMIAKEMFDFQKSPRRDVKAYINLKLNINTLMDAAPVVKDPLMKRLWHSVVTAFKGFLHWIDVMLSKVTGKTIDQPGRPHFFTTPKLNVKLAVDEAKKNYFEARDKVFADLYDVLATQEKINKPQ